MNQQNVETNLKIAQHYARLFKQSHAVNPFAARKLVAALSVLEREIFSGSEKKKPARYGVGT